MKYNCKKISKLICNAILSNFGALILVIMYLIGGGALFVFLELDNEKLSCQESHLKYKQKLNETTERAVTISEGGYNKSVLYTQILYMLGNFSKDVYTLGVSPTLDCETLGQPGNLPSWNLPNSIYFCATIMTTIGYGHISPVTKWGRIICIIYSFIGIPLMLLFLGSLGELLAGMFRSTYLNLCCCKCFLKHRRHQSLNENTNESNLEKSWAKIDEKQIDTINHNGPPIKVTNVVEVYENEEDDEEEEHDVNIPIIVVTGFLFFYMVLGALLFQIWEDWDLTAGVYFSFITVSTIGFGDLYPAKDTIGSDAANVELVIGCVYSLIGLAVLSMCLTLIQDEITGKFQWLGQKIGFVKPPEEENHDPEDGGINTSRTIVGGEFNDIDSNDFTMDDTKAIIKSKGPPRTMPQKQDAFVNNSVAVFTNDTFDDTSESSNIVRRK